MFAPRYFAARYFAPRYWPPVDVVFLKFYRRALQLSRLVGIRLER